MKRRVLDEKRVYDFAGARFFSAMPQDIRDGLSPTQRTAIIQTILKLQRFNPRLLDEIYMEQPYANRKHGQWHILDRIWRRFSWLIHRLWLGLIFQKSEKRARTRWADYLFMLYSLLLILVVLFAIIMFFYWLKSMMGIDLLSNMHFFTAQ